MAAGELPSSPLVMDKAGDLYGTTIQGGNGSGNVYRLSPPAHVGQPWTETVIYEFQGLPNDGASPQGSLVMDAAGHLYGEALGGGRLGCRDSGSTGCGLIYELSPPSSGTGPWTETIVYEFQPGGDGWEPVGGMAMDSSGALYGATLNGGSAQANYGTVFRLTPPSVPGNQWTETILHVFGGTDDGRQPYGGPILDAAGNLYGLTNLGGRPGCEGTAYELSPPNEPGGNWAETILHNFRVSTDGWNPTGSLTFDRFGNLYGTTYNGVKDGQGTLFSLTPPASPGGDWKETIIVQYTGPNGAYPYRMSTVFDSEGTLWVPTDGVWNGTLSRYAPPASPGGLWTTLFQVTFPDNGLGAYPGAGVYVAPDGTIYGLREGGTVTNSGSVFEYK
jgi:uncharacterized repeat protein (TIGR03803 family)